MTRASTPPAALAVASGLPDTSWGWVFTALYVGSLLTLMAAFAHLALSATGSHCEGRSWEPKVLAWSFGVGVLSGGGVYAGGAGVGIAAATLVVLAAAVLAWGAVENRAQERRRRALRAACSARSGGRDEN